MKQVIPFQKEIVFRTMIGEITSISLEQQLRFSDSNTIEGDFIVSGSYKMTEASQIEEDFSYRIPVDITIDDKYDTTGATFAIDDFTYDIVNEEMLKVHIELLLDGLEEITDASTSDKEIELEEVRGEEEELDEVVEMLEEKEEEPVTKISDVSLEPLEEIPSVTAPVSVEVPTDAFAHLEEKEEVTPSIDSIFSALEDTEETFSTYSVYIVRENDTLEGIVDRYQTTKEELAPYNNLDEIKVGTKLIIPTNISK